jgi:hypothetical protein
MLQRPLFYVFVLVAVTTLCWRANAAGFMVVSGEVTGLLLTSWDGESLEGTAKLPWSHKMSWAGGLGNVPSVEAGWASGALLVQGRRLCKEAGFRRAL